MEWHRIRWKLKRAKNIIPSMILCARFPFLYPRNRFSGLHYTNWKIHKYHVEHWSEAFELNTWRGEDGSFHVSPPKVKNRWVAFKIRILDWIHTYPLQWIHFLTDYTELDAMDEGWRKSFGIQMCKEIKEALLRNGGRKALRSFRITQIKEKWGQLCFYNEGCCDEVNKIIEKYEYISGRTCIVCGRPADYFTQGWRSPYCEKHVPEREKPSAQRYYYDIPFYGYQKFDKTTEENNNIEEQ